MSAGLFINSRSKGANGGVWHIAGVQLEFLITSHTGFDA